jgi:DNA-binding HxlR family transcriptional regulator
MPPKVEYELTPFGKSLIPVIEGIGLWGDEHQERLRKVILAGINAQDASIPNED